MMGRAKTALQCGFLMMIFLISGISALRCYRTSSVLYNNTGHITDFYISDNITTCKNACLEAQVMLRIDGSVLSLTDRRCAYEEPDGAGSNSSGDPHFTVKSNVRYCFTDLCNQGISGDVLGNPEEDTAPEESSSNKCYSGITFSPKQALKEVTCRKGYSLCYHGHSTIQTGRIAVQVFTNTCQRPSCVAPKNQSFGSIEFSQWGSCCNGSDCNKNEMTTPGNDSHVTFSLLSFLPKPGTEHDKERIPPVPGTGPDTHGSPFNCIPPQKDSVSEIDSYDDERHYGWQVVVQAEAVRFQSCPVYTLLTAIGIVVFEAWW